MELIKMTRSEIIEALMEEWWDSLDPNVADSMIDEYCDSVGVEIVGEQ